VDHTLNQPHRSHIFTVEFFQFARSDVLKEVTSVIFWDVTSCFGETEHNSVCRLSLALLYFGIFFHPEDEGNIVGELLPASPKIGDFDFSTHFTIRQAYSSSYRWCFKAVFSLRKFLSNCCVFTVSFKRAVYWSRLHEYHVQLFLINSYRNAATLTTHISHKRLLSTPQRPDRLRGPPNLLYNGHREGGVRRPGPRSWPLTTIQCRGQEWWSYASTPPHAFIESCLIN
jgi:hypothetical protein